MPSSPREMMQAVVSNLPKKTGKSIEQWIAVLRKDGPPGSKEQVQWLKSVHKLGHVTAQIVIASAEGRGDVYENEQKLVDELFGANAQLKKIYRELLRAIKPLSETKVKPCKTYVPFSRRRQFAMVKPAGQGHVDLHLAFGARPPANGRLMPSNTRDGRLSRVVRLSSPAEVDAEVRDWLKQAYAEAS